MSHHDFQPGDDVRVTWAGLKDPCNGFVLAPDHNLDMRGYLVECGEPARVRWIPEHGLEPLGQDDGPVSP